ncbi:MAG: pirin family protein [Candidatus Omnitrophota bacterium]|nr:pirin family protein [Candidatus Omnitrophota bacterium]
MTNITIRPAQERGHANHGWLDSYHTFSFADYHDPAHMGFRTLRVINEDRVHPGKGFGTHPHRDMEIITIVLEGALAHKDSMGNASAIRPGEIQRLSAGTGVMHSEFNQSSKKPVHLLQIWILPTKNDFAPSYEQKHFSPEEKKDNLRLIVSQDGRQGSLTIHQDVQIYDSHLQQDKEVAHLLEKGRGAWVQVTQGKLNLNDALLKEGDGAAIKAEGQLRFRAVKDTEFLLFDLS